MSDLAGELRSLAQDLRALKDRGDDPPVREPLERVEHAAAEAAKAWSGSSLGYHSRVYYDGLRPPPPGARFSQEWGLTGIFQGSTGDWVEYSFDEVYRVILEGADADLSHAEELAEEARAAFADAQSTVRSVLANWLTDHPEDSFIAGLSDDLDGIVVLDARGAAELQVGTGQMVTRDMTALGQGLRPAPHQAIIGEVVACRSPLTSCGVMADVADRSADHIDRSERRERREQARSSGSYVFIGHGRSPAWRELKDFIEDRLGLRADEFNRVPVAGVTNVERLVQMLDDAALALVVLTAEDERTDGAVVARQNVVHEAGLFQGRLGFSRAILVLEEGCEEFSNIAGLGQIRFPAGNISAAFEEVRRVIEREGLI